MKKMIIIFIALAGLVFSCSIIYPRDTVRYKITVEIETPEGVKVGSAVREVTVQQQPELPEGHAHIKQKGEAVTIDLGVRGIAFAVMGTDDYWTFFNAFAPENGPGNATEAQGMRYYKSVKGKKSLGLKDRPLIVFFRDIDVSKSVEAVYRVYSKVQYSNDPADLAVEDNFEKIFGSGVRLKDIIIEPTDEPITWGIQKWLPWLKEFYGKQFDGSRYEGGSAPDILANKLTVGHFSTAIGEK